MAPAALRWRKQLVSVCGAPRLGLEKGFLGAGARVSLGAGVPICRAVLSSQTSAAVGSNRLGWVKEVRGDRRGGRGCK